MDLEKMRKLHEIYGHQNYPICICGKINDVITVKGLIKLPLKNLATIQYIKPKYQIFVLSLLIYIDKNKIIKLMDFVNEKTKYFITRLLKEIPETNKDLILEDLNSYYLLFEPGKNYVDEINGKVGYLEQEQLENIIPNFRENETKTYYLNKIKEKYLLTSTLLKDRIKKTIEPPTEKLYKNKYNLIIKNPSKYEQFYLSKFRKKLKEKELENTEINKFRYKTQKELIEIVKTYPKNIKAFIFSYLALFNKQKIQNIYKKTNDIILYKILNETPTITEEILEIIKRSSIKILESKIKIDTYVFSIDEKKLYNFLKYNKNNFIVRSLIKNILPKFTFMNYTPRATKIQHVIIPGRKRFFDLTFIIKNRRKYEY